VDHVTSLARRPTATGSVRSASRHRYDTADVPGVESKHYLANGYVVEIVDGEVEPDDQHEAVRVFNKPPEPCHEYVRDYVETAEAVDVVLIGEPTGGGCGHQVSPS